MPQFDSRSRKSCSAFQSPQLLTAWGKARPCRRTSSGRQHQEKASCILAPLQLAGALQHRRARSPKAMATPTFQKALIHLSLYICNVRRKTRDLFFFLPQIYQGFKASCCINRQTDFSAIPHALLEMTTTTA